MYELKEIKKLKTYFNGFLTNKENYEIRFSKLETGDLLSVMIIDGFTIKYLVKSVDGNADFKFDNLVVKFVDFYDKLGGIKGVKLLDFRFNEKFYLFIEDKTSEKTYPMEFHQIKTRNFDGETIANVQVEALSNAIGLNSSSAKNGVSEFDSNVAVSITNDTMYLNSYTKGLYVGNKLSIENGKPFQFTISNNKFAMLKKWFKYAKDPRKINDDYVMINIYSMHLAFNIGEISIIFPINVNVKDVCQKYEAITNFAYPTKEKFKFSQIKDLVSKANKEKKNEIDFEDILEHSSTIYRPLVSDVIYQLSDMDGGMVCNVIDSKNDIIQIKVDLPFLYSTILFFSRKQPI